MESGSSDATQFFTPLSDAVAFTESYAASCGCNMTSVPSMGSKDPLLVCLRALPVDQLMKSVADVFNPNWPDKAAAPAFPGGLALPDYYKSLGFPEHLTPPNLLPRAIGGVRPPPRRVRVLRPCPLCLRLQLWRP